MKILLVALDWGLGHAARCIPIIRALEDLGHQVILGSDGGAYHLLKKEFPKLPIIELPAYNIYYKTENMAINMVLQLPKIAKAAFREHQFVKKVVIEYNIDVIISDNRFGCYSHHTKNIFITHQINIQTPSPFLSRFANYFNHFFIKKFDVCWIPDFENKPNLSGQLSHGISLKNTKYIGSLSRMAHYKRSKKYDAVVVLSGPEPQRTYLEEKIIGQAKDLPCHFLIVRGKMDTKKDYFLTKNIKIVSYLTTKALNDAIMESEVMISRSGYSTVMDLVNLQKKAILIPTPGQTEQEYLAENLMKKGIFFTQSQKELDIAFALRQTKKYTGFIADSFERINLKEKIKEGIKKIDRQI